MNHIAVMDKGTINKVLNGTKTIESRFSKNKIAPYQKIEVGDTIYLKESGGNITAAFTADKVLYFDNLTQKKVNEIRTTFGHLINANNDYWEIKKDANYGTLIYIKNPIRVTPVKINKKGRSGFVSNIKSNYI